MPLHNLFPCVFLKGRNNILAVALSDTSVLSGVTSHTLFPPLLQGKQVLSHVSIASFDSGDCSFTVLKKKPQCPNPFLSCVFFVEN